MPDLETHIQQAHHNEQCALHLLTTPYRDWPITAAFYAAVHLAEASFIYAGLASTSNIEDEGRHSYRKRQVNKLSKTAFENYINLFDASYAVRYLSHRKALKIAPQYYTESQVKDFVLINLSTVRTELEKALKISLGVKKKP